MNNQNHKNKRLLKPLINTKIACDQIVNFLGRKHEIVVNEQRLSRILKNRDITKSQDPVLIQTQDLIKNIYDAELRFDETRIKQSTNDRIKTMFKSMKDKKRQFELFTHFDFSKFKAHRTPAEGIKFVPFHYHRSNVFKIPDEDNNLGPDCDPVLVDFIRKNYPQFIHVITDYCRPDMTTEAIFRDFNRPQYPSEEPSQERLKSIMELIFYILRPKPYSPIHFLDVIFGKLPLNTGTGYYHKRSYVAQAHAKFSHPKEYSDRPTSKGYFVNFHYLTARSIVHRMKCTGLPFILNNEPLTKKGDQLLLTQLSNFYNSRPTLLYCRSHISKRKGEKKVRPVYGVDDLFLHIEAMLTLPLIVQARSMDCAIMHSLETLRGGNDYLDKIAQNYQSFATLDYSRFDQTLPRVVTNYYFTEYLPRLIIINKGYQPTVTWPHIPPEDVARVYYLKHRNLLFSLHTWFNNMTFLSADGYAYRRMHAGVPSGLLNTQSLDSFGNLFIILDSLLEYGLTPETIKRIRFFVMGDDNVMFTHHPINELENIVQFIIEYVDKRWHMVINPNKCVLTDNRQKINTLSYDCNFGHPKKEIDKLCAQLLYPEHGVDPRFMSSRAIGIAYASCMIDEEFYNLCKDIYHLYLPYATSNEEMRNVQTAKQLPGPLKIHPDVEALLDITSFPTPEMIRDIVTKWKGELDFDHKWAKYHFINPPNHEYENPITIYDYAQLENHKFINPIQLM